MSNILEDLKKEFEGRSVPQLDHARENGGVVTIPLSVSHLNAELSAEAAEAQAPFDARALQRELAPVLEAGRWEVIGTVSGAEAAVEVRRVPTTIDYADVPVGAHLLADSAQSSAGSVVRISKWRYDVDEDRREVTIYPNGDRDTQLNREINSLEPAGWRVIEAYVNRADGSIKDPVILAAPPGVKHQSREGIAWTTELNEQVYQHWIDLDRKLRNEEEN